jgi:catechol 2,3-dioxygenase-like lactoylglutathione lyase family enzyme
MLDHVSVAVRDPAMNADDEERALGVIGLRCLVERPATIGFGKACPEFWLNARPDLQPVPVDLPPLPVGTGRHICFRAADEETVRAFRAWARAAAWSDAGAPGQRRAAVTQYHAAFVQDRDGTKLEAAHFPRKT